MIMIYILVSQVNNLGMGVVVPEGQHRIEMHYRTSLLGLGLMVALRCWGIFGCIYYCSFVYCSS